MADTLILHSHYERRDIADVGDAAIDGYGTFTLDLRLGTRDATLFPAGAQLAIWCTMLLEPTDTTNARVVDRVAGHAVFEPLDHSTIAAAGRWTIAGLRSSFPARHANDGPESAYLILPDGATRVVDVIPATTTDPPTAPQASSDDDTGVADGPPLVPFPAGIEVAEPDAGRAPTNLRLVATSHANRSVWDAVAALAARLGQHAFHPAAMGESPVSGALAHRSLEVGLVIDESLGTEAYRLAIVEGSVDLVGGDDDGLRHGLVTLAQWAESGLPTSATIDDRPALSVRIVHLDLARRWYEPDVVERLIDLAAWRKMNRVHLHLTDDEAWRVPVAGYPTLGEIGGTRGHGLPIGPLCGSGPEPYGRAYTSEEIARWVQRADDLGVVLIPEVDVPGHCLAALAALPELRDPDDTSGAASVQGYLDNVLVPGHPQTMPFLAAVFGSLAELFPNSPWLHIGGDEVPEGAWSDSPIVARYAADRGLTTKRDIETQFHREIIEMIRTSTGRDVAMWEEAALGGLDPSGYAVAWTSVESGRLLAAAGHQVVLAPGQAYYLDMAPDRDWDTPGSSWAGTATLDTTCDFDPFGAVDATLSGEVVGVQACIWGEHIASLEILDRLVFPRLDAIAERGWTGTINGGADGLRRRASTLPRFMPS